MPILFSPVDQHVLYLGSNVLFKTTTGGSGWDIISPDLTRETYEVPANLGIFTAMDPEKGKHRGVIYTVAPSFRDVNVIWVGTDDGLIHRTTDGGKNWKNVTPSALTPWSKVSLMTASHFDDNTAYAAVNRFRLDDLRPHIYRTHDAGTTWTEITRGIPANEVVNSVREDPKTKGLLFAGTERAVYVSFNDGDDWQSLRLNMPATSIRDLVIHDDDIVVGTHGRSFWILDDMSPLRSFVATVTTLPKSPETAATLFKPRDTYRFRRNKNTDTPLPPEEPVGKNPPDGAIIYYHIKPAARGPVTLEILDAAGKLVRKFSSADPVDTLPRDLAVPTYWMRPPTHLSAAPGSHRFVWDLHYPPPAGVTLSYPISAIFGDTPKEPVGPPALPGTYTARLTVNGKTQSQSFVVKMDPRVKMTPAEIQQQFDLSMRMAQITWDAAPAVAEFRRYREGLKERISKGGPAGLVSELNALDSSATSFETTNNLARLNSQAASLVDLFESADMPPTAQGIAAANDLATQSTGILAAWTRFRATDLTSINAKLKAAGLTPLEIRR
jgi:hypothetical protein